MISSTLILALLVCLFYFIFVVNAWRQQWSSNLILKVLVQEPVKKVVQRVFFSFKIHSSQVVKCFIQANCDHGPGPYALVVSR